MPRTMLESSQAGLTRIRADSRFPDRPLQSLWKARDLLVLLARRDIHLRYQHSVAGFGWALLQPLLSVLVLSAFRIVIGRKTDSALPYALYAASVLVPWTFFVHSLNQTSHSLLKYATVLTKVNFPRLVLPLSAVAGASADFAAALVLIPVLMLYYRVPPHWTLLGLPLFAVHLIALAAAMGIWLGFLNVRFRDISNALPFLTQLWFFMSPIAYTSDMLPVKWQFAAAFNPMEGILEGFRWSLFGSASPMLATWLAVSWLVTLCLLISGVLVFLNGEETLADVI